MTHGISARDVREPNAHVNASTGVRGVSVPLVGTTDVQNLDHKTFLSGDGSSPPLTVKQALGSPPTSWSSGRALVCSPATWTLLSSCRFRKVEATTQAIFAGQCRHDRCAGRAEAVPVIERCRSMGQHRDEPVVLRLARPATSMPLT